MRYTQLYGTILALFSNVTYHDKNVSALWHEEKLNIKSEIVYRAQRHSNASAEVAESFGDFSCCRPTVLLFGTARGSNSLYCGLSISTR